MSRVVFPILITASTPSDLFAKAMEAIRKGNDFYTQPFVSYGGEICQFMAPSRCLYEYLLIVAHDLSDLDAKAQGAVALGYDFIFGVVLWNGSYLQWMGRMNEDGAWARDAVARVDFDASQPTALNVAAGAPIFSAWAAVNPSAYLE